MTPRTDLARDGNTAWLDPARRYRVQVGSDGAPLTAEVAGAPLPLVPAASPGQVPGATGLFLAGADTPLRHLIRLQQASGHPVLLTDGPALCGVCGPTEVIRALAGADGASKQAGDAN